METIGNNTMYNGDVLATLMSLPDNSVDAVLTDPPYCTGGTNTAARQQSPLTKYSSAEKKQYFDFTGDNKDQRSFLAWCTLWMSEAFRVTKPGGVCMVFSDWRQVPVTTDALQAGGWIWRNLVPWQKPTCRPMMGEFKRECEYVLVGIKGKQNKEHKRCLPGLYRESIVSSSKRIHVTEKPVPLLEQLLQIVPEGGTVLDCFAGSGATGVACANTGRKFVGIELSPDYYTLAADRLRAIN
jgi:site-specific DNA-methyltransferase (adenine-specific)